MLARMAKFSSWQIRAVPDMFSLPWLTVIDPKSLAWQIVTTNPLPKSESLERKKNTVCWILQKFSQILNEGQPWLFSPPSTHSHWCSRQSCHSSHMSSSSLEAVQELPIETTVIIVPVVTCSFTVFYFHMKVFRWECWPSCQPSSLAGLPTSWFISWKEAGPFNNTL